jgi:small GTP-binding protein
MEGESDFDYTIKILILGDSNVGKTNFISQFIDKKFSDSYMSTSGIDLKMRTLVIKNKKIRIQLWDTAGQEKYKAITKNLFLKVQGSLIMYDITDEKSFTNLINWVKSVKEECGKSMQMILVGNKSDLIFERVIKKEKAMNYSQEQGIPYIETSSKTGDNVINAVIALCEKIMENTEIGNECSFTLNVGHLSQRKQKCC